MKTKMRRRNPIKTIFDTDNPPEDPQNELGYSAAYDEGNHVLVGWHVTNDAQRILKAIRAEIPLTTMGHDYQELGPGLYVSAVPHIWVGRATKKWQFLETLTPEERGNLALVLGKMVLQQAQTGYITKSEYEMANRDLTHYLETGGPGFVLQLAGQPFNISFWKPDFLKPLKIKAGPEPEIVEFRLKGIFAGFNDQPKAGEIQALVTDEFDGAYIRMGMMTIAQLVVWRNEAIVGMKKTTI